MEKNEIFFTYIPAYNLKEIKKSIKDYLSQNFSLREKLRGKNILLKPNLLWASPIETAITTHPAIIQATIETLRDLNCKLFLGDSPGWGSSEKVLQKIGILEYLKKNKITLLEAEKNKIYTLQEGKILKKARLFAQLEEIDYIINLPKIKTHMMTGVSLCVKNLFGLIIGKDKIGMHFKYPQLENFYQMLFDLYAFQTPILNIVDGIISLEGQGPGKKGKPKLTKHIFISQDGILLDLFLIKWINEARALKNYLQNFPEKKDFYTAATPPPLDKPFLLPYREKKMLELIGIPEKYLKPIREKLLPYPKVENSKCILCQRCLNNCPQKVIRLEKEKITFDYTGCIKCYCCQEICPAGAIYLKKNIWQKIWGKIF